MLAAGAMFDEDDVDEIGGDKGCHVTISHQVLFGAPRACDYSFL